MKQDTQTTETIDLFEHLDKLPKELKEYKVIKRRNHAKYLQAYKTFINSKTVKK